jgi:sulfur transfer protein SufE
MFLVFQLFFIIVCIVVSNSIVCGFRCFIPSLTLRSWGPRSRVGATAAQKGKSKLVMTTMLAANENYKNNFDEVLLPKHIVNIKEQVVDNTNVSATLRNLIRYGDNWLHNQCSAPNEQAVKKGDPYSVSHTGFERVTGCTSTVSIRTSFNPCTTEDTKRKVHVEGSADSRVTRGMLAILCNVRVSIIFAC